MRDTLNFSREYVNDIGFVLDMICFQEQIKDMPGKLCQQLSGMSHLVWNRFINTLLGGCDSKWLFSNLSSLVIYFFPMKVIYQLVIT